MPLKPGPIGPRKPDPRQFEDNPGGEEWAAMEHADGPFFFCHQNVSEFKPGDVVSAKELGEYAQLDRLIKLGAISVAAPEHAEAYVDQILDNPPVDKPPLAPTPAPAPMPAPIPAPHVEPAKVEPEKAPEPAKVEPPKPADKPAEKPAEKK